MAEDKKGVDGVLEKIALISEATQGLFPDGKSAIVFVLNRNDFKMVQKHFRDIDSNYNKFKIDISGVEFIFILEETFMYYDDVVEKPKKESFWKRLGSLIRSKSSV